MVSEKPLRQEDKGRRIWDDPPAEEWKRGKRNTIRNRIQAEFKGLVMTGS